MPLWLTCLLWLLAWYLIFIKGYPRFAHWLAHKMQWEIGEHVTWRREPDHVLMVGRRCRICGKLTCIHPSRSSYKHMLRGRKWF